MLFYILLEEKYLSNTESTMELDSKVLIFYLRILGQRNMCGIVVQWYIQLVEDLAVLDKRVNSIEVFHVNRCSLSMVHWWVLANGEGILDLDTDILQKKKFEYKKNYV